MNSLNRIAIIFCFAWSILILSNNVTQGTNLSNDKPNVIFIIVDDSEYIDYGCYGGEVLTPNIDKLAESGVLFTNGFTSSSVCTPTRYTCMSGKYASRAESLQTEDHQPDNMPRFIRWNTHLVSGDDNVASVLQKNGYFTGLIGKWHVGQGEYYYEHAKDIKTPEKIAGKEKIALDDPEVNQYFKERYNLAVEDIKRSFGFDYVASYYGGNLTNWSKSLNNFAKHNQNWITQGAIDFLDESSSQDKPFFMYLSSTLQHGPEPNNSIEADRRISMAGLLDKAVNSQPSAESIYQRLDDAGISRDKAAYLWMDDGVGAVIKKLEESGQLENTAIFFFSDQQSWGKSSCYDGGVKTPYIFSWPAKVKANQVSDELVSNIDFVPTIFDICGVKAPGKMHLDGKSILPAVTGNYEPVHDAVFFELGDMRAVRTKDYKYIAVRHYSEDQWKALPKEIQESNEYRTRYFRHETEWKKSSPEHLKRSAVAKWRWDHSIYAESPDQLYDLRVDPSENMNVADNQEYSNQLKAMKQLLKDWLQEMPGPYWEFKEN